MLTILIQRETPAVHGAEDVIVACVWHTPRKYEK